MAALVLVALTVGTVGVIGPRAGAEDGYAGPDPSYAGDGALELTSTRSPMAVDSQDRLLVLRATGTTGAQLRRYLPNGTPDPAFSSLSISAMVASATRIHVLDDGWLLLVEADTNDSFNRTVRRVSPSGQLDATYGTAGKLFIGVDRYSDPFLVASTGTVVVVERVTAGEQIQRYGADGKLDPTFGGDGFIDLVCCVDGGKAGLLALQPDGDQGGLVALVRQGSTQALLRIAADGTVDQELPVPVATWGVALWAVPSGGFFLGFQASSSSGANRGSVHLDEDLVPDGGPADPLSGFVLYPGLSEAGDRTFATTFTSGGRTTITAYDAAGIDRTYGTNGVLVTEAMTPLNPDVGSLTSWSSSAVASDGRAFVTGSFAWAKGTTNPSPQYGQRIEAYAPDGRRLHRWDSRDASKVHTDVVAERVGSGFLVQHTVSTTNAQVQRWVPPREAAVLGPVRNATVSVTGDQATASWQVPAPSPGLLISGYEVVASVVGGPVGSSVTKETTSTTTTVTLSTGAPLTVHRFQIRAKGPGGAPGPATEVIAAPSPALIAAFLQQISTGFGTATTPAERAQATAAIQAGTTTPASLVRAAAQGPAPSTNVDPVVRLFLAYFQRLPDPGGLKYWTGKRRAGTSVARISAVLEDSSEFRRTYGSLSNAAFVDLVYRNVLGRPGDAGGVAYWTGRLDRRATSRGHLMASFSESSEHVRRTRATVDVVSIHWGLLGRTPTAAEITRWAGPAPEGDAAAMAIAILASAEYLARLV